MNGPLTHDMAMLCFRWRRSLTLCLGLRLPLEQAVGAGKLQPLPPPST
jgi:hypothetical protein